MQTTTLNITIKITMKTMKITMKIKKIIIKITTMKIHSLRLDMTKDVTQTIPDHRFYISIRSKNSSAEHIHTFPTCLTLNKHTHSHRHTHSHIDSFIHTHTHTHSLT